MKIKYLIYPQNTNFHDYNKYINVLNQQRIDKINKLIFEKDKLSSLLTGLFIKNEICDSLNTEYNALNFSINQYGKPIITNINDYDFSVSHSAYAIAFADSNKKIGIDIEFNKDENTEIAKRFFCKNEYTQIISNNNPKEKFYEIWTKKESYIKMLGEGFHTSMNSFDVTKEIKNSFFLTQQIDNYTISICSEYQFDDNISIQKTTLDNLIKN